jgi:hypothetical protein
LLNHRDENVRAGRQIKQRGIACRGMQAVFQNREIFRHPRIDFGVIRASEERGEFFGAATDHFSGVLADAVADTLTEFLMC